ncbi:peptidoglycan D,D-transpeptidase FtsI family protein [Castellaniella hirudinis]|uniref:peptidoglycan D,D-transpeptidase FtsI family protein n=1 Tax=Castellaniella hirudinis TaxID=1144617 RepID=UPI0039C02DE3
MKRFGFHESPVLAGRPAFWRARLVVIVLMLAFAALVVKAVSLQILSNEFLQRQGERRYERTLVLPASRGKIFDRSGSVVLASSMPARAVWAIPEDFHKATDAQVTSLARLLGMSAQDIRQRTQDEGKNFVYLQRQVALDVADQIRQLKIPGVQQLPETRRVYPEGEVMAHIVGFTNIEDRGIEGIELAFNDRLSGQPGSRRVIKDRLGRVVEDVQAVVPPVDGQNLRLSIDAAIQFDTYTALEEAMREHKARAAAAIVVDVQTGEILAMVNLPTFDPNDSAQRTGQALRNRVMTDTFEPGSIMKPFTAALALDEGKVTNKTRFDTGNGRYRYQGALISDVGRYGVLDVGGIIQHSSNVGMTMISELLDSKSMWTKFSELGFGRVPQTDFPGMAAGRLRPWQRWRPIERATMAYGYGLSVSLIQVAHAYTAFARHGDMVSLSLLRREGKPTSAQVYSPEVALLMRGMLEAAAGPDGARRAQVQGYRVAGKSGTARKIVNGQYSTTKYRGSFVGLAPVSEPRIVVAVSIDEPSAGGYYGGRVAAPVFSDIVSSTLRRLGVRPDAPVDALVAVAGQGGRTP